MTISSAPEDTGVTSFVNEACKQGDVLGAHYRPSSNAVFQPDLQNLTHYFARPQLIFSGTAIALQGAVAGGSVSPNIVFTQFFTNGLTRLTGVFGLKYRMVFTVHASPTPFHQGLLVLAYQYGGDTGGSGVVFPRNSAACSVTNLPHVRLDVSTDTMVQLSVPFMEITDFVTANDADVNGVWTLYQLMPTPTVSGLSPMTLKVYFHIEDLEFVSASPLATSVIAVQSGKTLKPMDREFQNDAYPFSSAVAALSTSLRFLAKGVPALSSIAGLPAWWLEAGAGAIRAFGFSKPQIQDPIVRMQFLTSAAENNVDVASSTIMVGPKASNALVVDSSIGLTDVDEMALSYITSQFGQVAYFTFNNTSPTGTVLYATDITPFVMWYRTATTLPLANRPPPVIANATSNSFFPSHVFNMAQLFRYWRGSLKFRFTFCKTKMHGGRVFVGFAPSDKNDPVWPAPATGFITVPTTTGGANPFGYSALFDLRDSNVFEFTVPYAATAPWLPFTSGCGALVMSIQDPLIVSATVSSAISVLVEVAGGPDFELSCPLGPIYPPNIIANGTIQFQSGKVLSSIKEDAILTTAGETIRSVKELIMIPKCHAIGNIAGPSTSSVAIPPWYYTPAVKATVGTTTPPPVGSFGFAASIAPCYLFCRGSTDVHVYMDGAGVARIVAYASACPTNSNAVNNTTLSPQQISGSSLPRVFASNGAPLHIRYPAYQTLSRLRTYCCNASVPAGQGWAPIFGDANANPTVVSTITQVPYAIGRLTVNNGSTSGVNPFVTRSAGDDAILGHYQGPVPLFIPGANTAASLWDPESGRFV